MGTLFPCTEAEPQEVEGKEQSCVAFFREPSGKNISGFIFLDFFKGDYLFLYDEI